MSIWQVLKFMKNEFVYGGHLISLGASSVVFTSAIILDIKITWDFIVIVYLIFYIIYSYNRLKEFKNDLSTNSLRVGHLRIYKKYLPLIIFLYLLLITFLVSYFGNPESIFFGFLILILGLFYTVYFKKVTKKIVGFKSLYVSFVWALLVIFLALYYSFSINLSVLLIFSFIFLRLMTNTVFFDVKDLESDKACNLKTIPVFLGEKKTLIFVYIINIFSFIPLVYGVYKNLFPLFPLILIIFCFYSFYYLRLAKDIRINIQNLSYILVDGEYLLWSVAVFLSKVLIFGK